MPNHVTNVLTLHGDAARVREVLEAVRQDGLVLGSVDFNKILPMPESLNIEASSKTDAGLQAYRDFIEVYTLGGTLHQDELADIPRESEAAFLCQRPDIQPEVWALGKTAWNNLRLYGAATWYDWRVRHWGSKWNAYGCEDGRFREGNRLAFQTAWSAPHPVLRKLAELFPDVEIEHEWADEDIGCNCGRYRYRDGVCAEEWFPETEREAVAFACSVMGAAPEAWGLALNVAGTGYIYLEDEKYERIELLGKPALFTNARLTDADVPAGLYCYHLRHSDNGSRFCSVEPRVGVNHGGSVLLREPLDFGKRGYLSFTAKTEPNFIGASETFADFLNEAAPQEAEEMTLG